jgi:lipid II:glycine glycyltransferase (peptidoglycan interpeptide bridge formation enzyme)
MFPMLIRPIRPEEKDDYNKVVHHPLQSWEWGQFRAKTGLQVERLGFFDNGKLKNGVQATFHPIPVIGKTAGYIPKGYMPDDEQLAAITQLGKKNNALFVKLEPNVANPVESISAHHQIAEYLLKKDCKVGRSLFTKYTFILDLTKDEDTLFANLSSKTRYNVNLAYKKGVRIYENTSAEGMETYIKILETTTKRQGFYAHGPNYFRTMWETLGQSGMLRIFHAEYEGQILTSWIMFIFNNVLYYPYGASVREHRDVMANNLMMWEMIKFGLSQGCTSFDMWGSLGSDPDPKHPWFGFHRFKKGYGGVLYETLGTYDLVVDNRFYGMFRVIEEWRWKLLRLKAALNI